MRAPATIRRAPGTIRKKQTENAYKRQNPPKSNKGNAFELVLGFGDDRFHTGSPILSLNCRRMSV